MPSLIRALVLLLVLALQNAFAAAPTITVPTSAAGVGDGTQNLTVNVTANGAATTVTFSFGLTVAYGSTATASVVASAVGLPTTVALTGLIGGQTYHFKVSATNSDGSAADSADQTFMIAAYAPTLTLLQPTHAGGVQTIHATVTSNGTPGDVFFQYGATTGYGTNSPLTPVLAGTIALPVNFPLPMPLTYHYRFVFDDGVLPTPDVVTVDDLSNDPPVAVADSVKLSSDPSLTVSVLLNDTDANGDTLTISTVSAPKNGTAVIIGTEIEYTPGPNFVLSDTFTYAIDDGFAGISTATVTIRALVASLAGTHGGLVKKANGREVGYFTLTTTSSGSFSGIAIIDGKRYMLTGFLGADGSFQGYASGSGGVIPVRLSTTNNDTGTVITATFGNGQYTSDLSVSDTEVATRIELARRYTAGIAAGGSGPTNGNDPGTPPEGSGWVAARVRQDGTAAIKGRLSDGRNFATRGTVNIVDGVATLSFFDDLEGTRFFGNLTLGDTVGGNVRTELNSSGDGLYPRGYDITQTVDGARYIPPASDKRVLDTTTSKGQDLNINFAGGTLAGTLTRDLYLDDHDKVKVINSSAEELKVRIDRRSGRFQAKVIVETNGKPIKATGVLVQAPEGGTGGRGIGTFKTSTGTGTVTISAGSGGGTTTTTGTTTGTVVP